METFWNGFVDVINSGIDMTCKVLPVSPFRQYIDAIGNIKWLGIVNYFIPIATFIAIFSAWLTCLAVYYVYSIIMRWIKIVGE